MRDKTRLAIEQQLLESVLDQLPVGILIRRSSGVTALNRKLREFWQLKDSDVTTLVDLKLADGLQYFASRM